MWFWSSFKGSGLWRLLKRVSVLRSGYYLAIELGKTWTEARTSSLEAIESDFNANVDPWAYETSAVEQARFTKQTEMLDAIREGKCFSSGLEIGCAEGLYTEVLAGRCISLQVLDFSPTALARAQHRREWSNSVRFDGFDLRNDQIPGSYDLIVIAGVLEYFSKAATFRKVRTKLCAALRPDGILLLETTRVNAVVENAWWSRFLIRGKWINEFVSRGTGLTVVSSVSTDNYLITIYKKSAERR
jgi:2-polyprenyl-3-methyl-5-hydroxy-6-metoxy-1,4-benzoquinol methylase